MKNSNSFYKCGDFEAVNLINLIKEMAEFYSINDQSYYPEDLFKCEGGILSKTSKEEQELFEECFEQALEESTDSHERIMQEQHYQDENGEWIGYSEKELYGIGQDLFI